MIENIKCWFFHKWGPWIFLRCKNSMCICHGALFVRSIWHCLPCTIEIRKCGRCERKQYRHYNEDAKEIRQIEKNGAV